VTRIFHRLFLWKWIPCQTSTSVLCLLFRPKTVHCSTKNTYTSEITFLALVLWVKSTIVMIVTRIKLAKLAAKRIEYIEGNLENLSVWIFSVPFSLNGSSKCTNHVNVHKLYAVEYIYTVCILDYPFQFRIF